MAVTDEGNGYAAGPHQLTRKPRLAAASASRRWTLDHLPVGVLVFAGDEVVAVNTQWTALTGLDVAPSQVGGWPFPGPAHAPGCAPAPPPHAPPRRGAP